MIDKFKLMTALWLVIFCLFSFSKTHAQTQLEATQITTFNQPFSAVYNGTEDQWWKFNATANEIYTIKLTARLDSGNLDYALYQADGTQMTSEYNVYDEDEAVINHQMGTSGTYYIRVFDSGSGNYDLTLYKGWATAGVNDSDRDFYHTFETARYLTSGTYHRSFMPDGTLWDDYYYFSGRAGQTISIALTGQYTNGGNLDMTLYNSAGSSLSSVYNIYDNETDTLTTTLQADDVYVLKVYDSAQGGYVIVTDVDSHTNSDSDELYDAAEYYHRINPHASDTDGDGVNDSTELADGGKPQAKDEWLDSETGRSQSTAQAITYFNQPINSERIAGNGDQWWKFNAIANEIYTIKLTARLDSGNLDYALYQADGTQMTSEYNVYDEDEAVINHQMGTSGTYYIRVFDSGSGNYDLTLYKGWATAGVNDSDRDFYHTFETARYLTSGTYHRSFMPDGTLWDDYYYFSGRAGQTISIALTGQYTNGGNLDMTLYNSAGSSLSSVYNIYDNETDTLTTTLQADDVYVLKVYDSAQGGYVIVTDVDSHTNSDSDELYDAAEYYHRINPHASDTDGDGVNDSTELADGGKPQAKDEWLDSETGRSQSTAQAITYFNQPINSERIAGNGDQWWKFNAIANEIYTIKLTARLDSGNLDYALYQADGTQMTSEYNVYDEDEAVINHQMGTSGTYYIRVFDSGSGNYDLTLYKGWATAGVNDSDRDFYHTFETARYLTSGTYHRSFMPDGTLWDDYYYFSGRAGQTISIALTGQYTNGGNLDMTLYNSAGSSLSSVYNIYDNETDTLTTTLQADDVYVLKVYDSAQGGYVIVTDVDSHTNSDSDELYDAAEYYHRINPHASDTDGDGVNDSTELADGGKPQAKDEWLDSETGRSQSTAQAITYFNQPINSERIAGNGDQWWKFNAIANEIYTIKLTARLDSGNLDYALYQADGTQMTSEYNVYDEDEAVINHQMGTSGTYYIRVFDSGSGNYDLTLYKGWATAGVNDSDRDFYHTFETARYLTSGTYHRSFMPDGTLWDDYYYFSGRAGQTISIALTGQYTNGGNLDMTLYNSAGSSLSSVYNIYDNETDTLTTTLQADDVYVLKVYDSAQGGYMLTTDAGSLVTQTSSSLDPTNPDHLLSMVADPVDVATGAHVLTRTVMQIEGALPLTANLYYSSRDPIDRGVGYGWSHSYQMNIEVETDNSLTLYWPTGRITRYKTPIAGLYQNVDGDARDEMRSITNGYELTDANHTHYIFNSSGQLTQKQTKTGMAINYNYVSDRLNNVTEPVSGRSIAFAYDSNNRIATISAADTGSVTLGYDVHGNLTTLTTAVTSTQNATEQFTYDSNHRILTGIDPLNITFFSNNYDAQGRVIAQEDARTGNLAGTFTYTDNGNGTTTQVYSDRTGATKTYVHDDQYRLIALTDELGNTTHYSYDAQGNRVSETDAHNYTTHYAYDLNSNLIRVTNSVGGSTNFSFDEDDNLVSIIGPEGHSSQFIYDSSHRLISTTDPLNNTTSTEYNSDGLVVATTNELGGRTTYTLIKGQPQTVTDSTGHSVIMSYDDAGRMVTLSDGTHTTQYEYNLKGQLVRTINPMGGETTNSYDVKGRLMSVTNPRGYTTTYSYDNSDKLTAETDPLNGVTRYTYDGEDRITTITDAIGQATATFDYDAKGQVIAITDALNRTTAFNLDAVGNVVSELDPTGQTTQSRYDAMNRVIEKIDALNRVQGYRYDKRGNLVITTLPGNRQTQFSYDGMNQHTQTIDAIGGTVKQSFNGKGQPTQLIDPNNQRLTFEYDSEGRLLKTITSDGKFWQTSYTSRGEIAQLINARGHVTQ